MSEMSPGVLRVETLHSGGEHSCAIVALRGLNRATINHGSITLYHVISGEGVMYVGGKKHELLPGTIIEVPPGTPYYDEGTVDMEAFCAPPFEAAAVETIDERYQSNFINWIRVVIGTETGRDGSDVTLHEIFQRYNDGGFSEWDSSIAEAVRDCLQSIGVANVHV